MSRRRRAARAMVLATLLLGACGGEDEPTASPSPSASASVTSPGTTGTTGPTGPTATGPSSSPTPPPELRLPPDAPTTYTGAISAEGPFDVLVPPGAEVLAAWFQAPPGGDEAFAGVAWGRGDDPFARELGLVVWEGPVEAGAWRATFAFTDDPARGVLGISLDVADLTRDGIEEALTFEQTGGSGACGVWRVVAPYPGGAEQVFKRSTCDAEIAIVDSHLELTEAVYEPEDAHCCPSAFRTTTLEWDGSAFVETDVRLEETSPA